ncbi:hypothetical protein LTR94_027192, partial [Friedmanniomyces endolithicus]
FQHFAGEIFIDPPVSTLTGQAVWARRPRLIQIDQHGGVLFAGLDQVLKPAKDMGPNGLSLILIDQGCAIELGGGDAQYVGPEQGPALSEGGGLGVEAMKVVHPRGS